MTQQYVKGHDILKSKRICLNKYIQIKMPRYNTRTNTRGSKVGYRSKNRRSSGYNSRRRVQNKGNSRALRSIAYKQAARYMQKRTETKFAEQQNTQDLSSSTKAQNVVEPFQISKGDAYYQRTGNKIFAKGLKIEGYVDVISGSSNTSHHKVVVLAWRPTADADKNVRRSDFLLDENTTTSLDSATNFDRITRKANAKKVKVIGRRAMKIGATADESELQPNSKYTGTKMFKMYIPMKYQLSYDPESVYLYSDNRPVNNGGQIVISAYVVDEDNLNGNGIDQGTSNPTVQHRVFTRTKVHFTDG